MQGSIKPSNKPSQPHPPMETEIQPPQIQPSPTDSQTVEQCLGFLSRKDDTSRFVGLAILSSLLTHLQDRAALVRCWEALDPRFLDRLLKAGACDFPEEGKGPWCGGVKC